MKCRVPYGDRWLDAVVDDARVAAVLSSNGSSDRGAADCIPCALSHPVASTSLEAFLSGARDVLCIVNDASRPSPTEPFLDAVSGLLDRRAVRFMVATGSHPSPSGDEMGRLFGKHHSRWHDRILVHDARRDEESVVVGTTRFGNEIRFNRRVLEADRIVVLGTVEPHYFAGFTGGRKSFLPGCAAYATIERNHELALSPASRVCALEGNPVHDDMEEAAAFLRGKPVFALMTVFDPGGRIRSASAGDLSETFRSEVQRAEAVHCLPVSEPADIVVGVLSPPLDMDLYQAHKALENAKAALRPGGIFILVAPCQNGIGNDAFARLLSSASDPRSVLETVRREYRLGFHKSARIAEFVLQSQLWAVTDLAPAALKPMFIRPFRDLQTALDKAMEEKPGGTVLIVLSAGTSVPVPAKETGSGKDSARSEGGRNGLNVRRA